MFVNSFVKEKLIDKRFLKVFGKCLSTPLLKRNWLTNTFKSVWQVFVNSFVKRELDWQTLLKVIVNQILHNTEILPNNCQSLLTVIVNHILHKTDTLPNTCQSLLKAFVNWVPSQNRDYAKHFGCFPNGHSQMAAKHLPITFKSVCQSMSLTKHRLCQTLWVFSRWTQPSGCQTLANPF